MRIEEGHLAIHRIEVQAAERGVGRRVRRSARLLSLCVIALCVAPGHASVIRDMAFDALEIEQGQKVRTDGHSSTGRTEHATSLHVVAKMQLQLT